MARKMREELAVSTRRRSGSSHGAATTCSRHFSSPAVYLAELAYTVDPDMRRVDKEKVAIMGDMI
jgi:hypothetical protein